MKVSTITHLMVDDTTIENIKVRSESSSQLDIVYIDLGDIDHKLCISGEAGEVAMFLLDVAGMVLGRQEVMS